ncbi:MAG: nicotinamide mononucleotide transporter [Bacteroidales bacterium]|nr:nicotinamide mononucleotide transporter [Bacteroidales bacterium]
MILEILGFSIGILYLWWEYHADRRVWLASVIMPMISMWIYFSKGLYADFSINIYYLVIAFYGFIAWTRGGGKEKHKKTELPISHITWGVTGLCVAASALLWWLIWLLLTRFTDSTVPVADAFTTALSIVGMWMMARKYAEQWLVWIVVDLVSAGLYFYKGIYFYSGLYAIYTVVACFGYRKWLRMIPGNNRMCGDN